MPAEAVPQFDAGFAEADDHAARPLLGERVACEHAEQCGGCPLIALTYAEQLERKGGHLAKAAVRYPQLKLVHPQPVAPAWPVVGYRTRAKLIVGVGGQVGLFAKGGGHRLIDVPGCRVLSPSLSRIAASLRTRFVAAEQTGGVLVPFDGEGRGCIRAIDLREVLDGDRANVLVTFVVHRDRTLSLEQLERAARDLMEAEPEVIGVACNFHDGDAPRVLGAQTVTLAGVTSAIDRVGPSAHFATFGSFVQAHRGQASRVHALLADAFGLSRGGRAKAAVLDLYGGSGSIALGLAAAGARVCLVESFAPAAAQARAAAASFRMAVDVECADAATALRTLADQGRRFDAVVVNPPRRGMSPTAREWLARLEPPVIAYVSCNPETLARDLDHFARLGYGVTSLHPIDMIPLTDEVETVAFVKPSAVPVARSMYEDREAIVVDKSPHEPTTPQGEYRGSLFARVRRIAGAEAAVPVHRLDVGASGLVLFVRKAQSMAKWHRALSCASASMIYVAGVRGVTPPKGVLAPVRRDGRDPSPRRTRYRRLAVVSSHSLLRIIHDAGPLHPLRRQLAALGHPVLGDNRFGDAMTNRFFEEKMGLDRPFLHAARLEFDHPDSGAQHVVESGLPGDLRAALECMGGSSDELLADSYGS